MAIQGTILTIGPLEPTNSSSVCRKRLAPMRWVLPSSYMTCGCPTQLIDPSGMDRISREGEKLIKLLQSN